MLDAVKNTVSKPEAIFDDISSAHHGLDFNFLLMKLIFVKDSKVRVDMRIHLFKTSRELIW